MKKVWQQKIDQKTIESNPVHAWTSLRLDSLIYLIFQEHIKREIWWRKSRSLFAQNERCCTKSTFRRNRSWSGWQQTAGKLGYDLQFTSMQLPELHLKEKVENHLWKLKRFDIAKLTVSLSLLLLTISWNSFCAKNLYVQSSSSKSFFVRDRAFNNEETCFLSSDSRKFAMEDVFGRLDVLFEFVFDNKESFGMSSMIWNAALLVSLYFSRRWRSMILLSNRVREL